MTRPPYASDGVCYAAYVGASMNPTLVEPEIVEIEPYADAHPPRTGDVILFRVAERAEAIIHRVVGITAEGIRTRGDNSPQDDSWAVQPAQVYGRVVAARRGARRRVIAGGHAGQVAGMLAYLLRPLNGGARALGRPLYRTLVRSGMVARLMRRRLAPRVLAFEQQGGLRLHLMLGRRVVGHYDSRSRRWRIPPLYRLFLDESALPHPGQEPPSPDGRRSGVCSG